MKLPYELIDMIIKNVDNYDLLFSLHKLLSRSTKRFLLREKNFVKEAEKGNIILLKIMHDARLSYGPKDLIDDISIYDNFKIIKYLSSIGFHGTSVSMCLASYHGRINIVKFLYSKGVAVTPLAMEYAITNKHLDVIYFFLTKGLFKNYHELIELSTYSCIEVTTFLKINRHLLT
jgi:hypothetical protein